MAAARAAARRQAILSSRGDRLAKLTSSARGDDPGGVYAHDDPPLPTLGSVNEVETFVGEGSALPSPPANTLKNWSSNSSNSHDANPQQPEWGSEEHQEFIRSLMDGAMSGQPGLQPTPSITASTSTDHPAPPAPEDPIAALMAAFGGGQDNSFTAQSATPPRPRTLLQKLIPVLHVLGMLAILTWFVGWKEPEEFAASWLAISAKSEGSEGAFTGYNLKDSGWRRWARLARGRPTIAGLVVPPVPAFFWAFTTLELALHTLRLFSQPDEYRPPMLLGLVLPYLPPPFPQAILTSLKYLQMGSMVLDDLAILVFGIGLVIFVSNWAT